MYEKLEKTHRKLIEHKIRLYAWHYNRRLYNRVQSKEHTFRTWINSCGWIKGIVNHIIEHYEALKVKRYPWYYSIERHKTIYAPYFYQ